MAIEAMEKEIQKSILDYLRIKGYLCKRNNAGMAFSTYNGKRRAFIVGASGWPDIEVILPGGCYCGIEVKTRKGIQSEVQKRVEQSIKKVGGRYLIARSIDDVVAAGL